MAYDTAKISLPSLRALKCFLDAHRRTIEEGASVIEYDGDAMPAGFILRAVGTEAVTKFPPETKDAFFALAVMSDASDKTAAASRLAEANLFRILNWNDTSALTEKVT